MKYQCNIMGTSIYHNMSVSQSCLRSFLCNPYISFQIFLNFLFTCLPSFFSGPRYMHFAIYLVANILANRACSLRLSNIFIATSCLCIILYQILLLVELLLMKYSKVVPGATIYKITRFYLSIILSFNTTQTSTFCATFLARYS